MVKPDSPPPGLPPVGFPIGSAQQTDYIELGPDLDHHAMQKLLTGIDGKRVLELGCAGGAASIVLAKRGARVIAVDPSSDRLVRARRVAEDAGIKVEFQQSDLADLAFVRADTVDVCVAIYSLSRVPDPTRLLRQVHRVLRPDGTLLISLPHPVTHLMELNEQSKPELAASYPSTEPVEWNGAGELIRTRLYSIGEVFTMLVRANFRVDMLLEPTPVATELPAQHAHSVRGWSPETVVFRARKVGL